MCICIAFSYVTVIAKENKEDVYKRQLQQAACKGWRKGISGTAYRQCWKHRAKYGAALPFRGAVSGRTEKSAQLLVGMKKPLR